MGFEQLDTAILQTPTEIRAEDVAWRGEKLDDKDALALVLADTQTAEAFVSGKFMTQDWERADNNFRAAGLPKNWPGVESQRAGMCLPVVMEAVEKLEAPIMLALFSDEQPFLLESIGVEKPGALRAKANLLTWATKLAGFKEEIRKCIKSALLYGFLVGRWGWKTATQTTTKYEMDPNSPKKVNRVVKNTEISHPTFENIELRKVLLDPALREGDVRKGRFAIVQIISTPYILDDLRGDPGYKNVPTREEFAEIMARRDEAATESLQAGKDMTWRDNQAAKETIPQSIDPLKAPLEILEYITDDRVVTVLQRKIVIRNMESEFGRTTLLGCAFIDVPGAAYGFGVSKLLAGEQYLQTSVLNSWLDVVALQLNPGYTAAQGLQTTAQSVKLTPGRILVGPDLKPIPVPSVGAEALQVLQTSENRASRRVGANGADNMPTQALRTAQGVQSFNEGVVDKLQNFIEKFSEKVYIPALEAFLDIMQDNLQPEDIQRILSETDGKAYEGSILDIYNAACKIKVLGSTKLAARRAAAQLAPLIMNFVSAPAVQTALVSQGMKFDYAEFLGEVVDLAGWDVNALIVKASPEEIQRAMSIQSPEQVRVQGQSQLQSQKHQDDLQNIEETALGRAGVQLITHAAKGAGAEAEGSLI